MTKIPSSQIVRTPNTRAVFTAALVNEIEKAGSLHMRIYSASKNGLCENADTEIQTQLGLIDGLYIIFKYPDKNARISIDEMIPNLNIKYFNALNQVKANLSRLYKSLFSKPHISKNNRKVLTVRGIDKLFSLTSTYNNLRQPETDRNHCFTNKQMMIFDVIATELYHLMKDDKEFERKMKKYKFQNTLQAEKIAHSVNDDCIDGKSIIVISLTNERIRELSGLNIEREKIRKLITEIAEIELTEQYYYMIEKEYRLEKAVKGKPYYVKCEEVLIDKKNNTTDVYSVFLNLTPFGCFLINNVICEHTDNIYQLLYSLSGTAQNIYRKIAIYSFKLAKRTEGNLKEYAGIQTDNPTVVKNTIKKALVELKDSGLIIKYEVVYGRHGRVYHIYMPSKKSGGGGRLKSKGDRLKRNRG